MLKGNCMLLNAFVKKELNWAVVMYTSLIPALKRQGRMCIFVCSKSAWSMWQVPGQSSYKEKLCFKNKNNKKELDYIKTDVLNVSLSKTKRVMIFNQKSKFLSQKNQTNSLVNQKQIREKKPERININKTIHRGNASEIESWFSDCNTPNN